MVDFRAVLRLFERDFIAKLFLLFLLYSLLPIFEIFVILYLGGVLGNYLALALAASTGLIGVLVAFTRLRETVRRLKERIQAGEYPGDEFIELASLLCGGVLLLTPGFFTDLFGFLLFVPMPRNAVGRWITRRVDGSLKEIYEYLKLYDF